MLPLDHIPFPGPDLAATAVAFAALGFNVSPGAPIPPLTSRAPAGTITASFWTRAGSTCCRRMAPRNLFGRAGRSS